MRIMLISMARRGGMAHFLAELANALAPMCETTVVTSTAVDETYFAASIDRVRIETGQDALRRILHTINPTEAAGARTRTRGGSIPSGAKA